MGGCHTAYCLGDACGRRARDKPPPLGVGSMTTGLWVISPGCGYFVHNNRAVAIATALLYWYTCLTSYWIVTSGIVSTCPT